MKIKVQGSKTYEMQPKLFEEEGLQQYDLTSRNKEKSQITLHLKQLEKEEKTKPKVRRKEIKKIKAEINEETKKTTAKINETKSWFSEMINKIDKPLARLIKKKKGENSNQ